MGQVSSTDFLENGVQKQDDLYNGSVNEKNLVQKKNKKEPAQILPNGIEFQNHKTLKTFFKSAIKKVAFSKGNRIMVVLSRDGSIGVYFRNRFWKLVKKIDNEGRRILSSYIRAFTILKDGNIFDFGNGEKMDSQNSKITLANSEKMVQICTLPGLNPIKNLKWKISENINVMAQVAKNRLAFGNRNGGV